MRYLKSFALSTSITTALLSGLVLPASAAFTAFRSLGTGIVVPDISCASDKPGFAVCATRGLQSTLLVDRYNGTAWSGWSPVSGVATSSPSCNAVAGGKVICVSRSSSGGMMATTFNGTAWSAQIALGGVTTSGPSCGAYSASDVVCVARNSTGGLTWLTTDGVTKTAPQNVVAATIFSPRCATDNPSNVAKNVICTYTSTNGTILAQRFNGTTATAIVNLGGLAASDTVCTNLGPGVAGKVLCMARSSNSEEYVNQFNGGAFVLSGWTGFSGLGGSGNYDPSCAASATNAGVCGAIGNTDSALYIPNLLRDLSPPS